MIEEKIDTTDSNPINAWIRALEQHKDFQSVHADVKDLKAAIALNNEKKVVALMTKIGSETIKATGKSDDSELQKIQNLGRVLLTSAKALNKYAR